MVLLDLLTALTHVATQMTGVWLPPPKMGLYLYETIKTNGLEKFRSGSFTDLELADWREIIELDASDLFPALSWFPTLLNRGKLTMDTLASQTFRHFQEMTADQGGAISIFSRHYPELLRGISRPPLMLSYKGNLDLLHNTSVAVIGSRKASYEALRASVDVGIKLAQEQMAVVSGGAIGCDIAVHEGMLAFDGDYIKPIVVFAGGLHSLHPKSHERAFTELLNRDGLFLSEKLWFQKTYPSDFPARNRIVSGMSECTVVMAAGLRSGSLITAQEALEQGREVIVFAGDVDDVRMDGSRQLILDGAIPFTEVECLAEILRSNILITPDKYFNCAGKTCQLANELGTFEIEHFIN